jgi:hypothetical protein
MPPPQNPPPVSSASGKRLTSYALGCVIVLAVALGAALIGNTYFFKTVAWLGIPLGASSSDDTIVAKNPGIASLEGTVYLALDKGGTRSFYGYNVYTKDFGKIVDLPGSLSTPAEVAISDDQTYIAFVKGSAEGNQVMLGYASAATKKFTFEPASLEQPTQSAIRSLAFSRDGNHIAYAAAPDAEASPSNWSLYLLSSSSKPGKVIGRGTSPAFGPDGEMFFLKDDGLYELDMSDASATESLVLATDPVQPEDRIALSSDGAFLSWSKPSSGVVLVFRVDYASPVSVTPPSLIAMGTYNRPFIDPTGSFVMGSLSVDPADASDAVLTAFDLGGNIGLPFITLAGFDPASVSVAGWTYVK